MHDDVPEATVEVGRMEDVGCAPEVQADQAIAPTAQDRQLAFVIGSL